MQAKQIKRDHWYQTTHGYGRVIDVNGGRSGARTRVEIVIHGPLPLGRRFITPRDVTCEIDAPAAAPPAGEGDK